MTDELKAAADSKTAEAIQSAAVATEAMQMARKADLDNSIAQGLEAYFEGRKSNRFIDVNRIPFICDDIKGIHETQNTMVADINLIKKIGGYILLGIGTLFLTLVGALLLRGI